MSATFTEPVVLVVDDEPAVRGLLVRWLTDAGYSCMEASNADDAWGRFRPTPIPLVTLDINLPGRSGLDLLPQIKEAFPDTEVLLLTGRGETQTAITALTQGASGYLIKPVAREELLFQVKKALEKRQLLIDKRHYTQHLEERVREQTQHIHEAHEETIHRLVAACTYRDEETGAHIRRVGLYSELIAQEIGWSSAQIDCIRMAAPMHDLGKIGIPDAILRKAGRLTPDEYEVMKTHAVIGAKLLSGSHSPVLQMASQIAHCHHERWAGQGYPAQLSKEAIPESARIVAIADVFDALTHDRVYQAARPVDEAITIIDDGCGSDFEPRLIDAFIRILPEIFEVFHNTPDNPTATGRQNDGGTIYDRRLALTGRSD